MLGREYKVYTTQLQGNTVLARDVISARGQMILAKGTELTRSQIVRLKQLGVLEVWVREKLEMSDDSVSEESIRCYESSIDCVQKLFQSARLEGKVHLEPTQRALQELWQSAERECNYLNLMINLRTLDDYTFQHSVGVGLIACWIGGWLGLSEMECKDLLLAGTLHDIGKSMLDQSVLQKPARLTTEEYEHVKQHAELGYQILLRSGVSEHIAAVARNHHERMDGSGYPRGLQEHQIDLFSRIVMVADVFNAMTSRRVYRDPASHYKVLDEVHQNAFGDLDPVIVSTFVNKMTSFLVGNIVGLNDGTVGTVVFIPIDRPTRPLVQVNGGFIDLKQRPDLYIEEVKAI